MPTLDKLEHTPDRERAYRRGYVHGIENMMTGIRHKLSDEETMAFDRWFTKELFAWSQGDTGKFAEAPAFPALGEINADRT